MKVNKTPLNGLITIELDKFQDNRGFFLETYQEERYNGVGITDDLFKIIILTLRKAS